MGGTPTSKFNSFQLSCFWTIGFGGHTHDEHHRHEQMGGSKQTNNLKQMVDVALYC